MPCMAKKSFQFPFTSNGINQCMVATTQFDYLHQKLEITQKVTAIAHYDEYVREKRLLMLVQRFRDMVFRQLYECEYEEWSSEDDEGDWEWVWEDEEEIHGDQMLEID